MWKHRRHLRLVKECGIISTKILVQDSDPTRRKTLIDLTNEDKNDELAALMKKIEAMDKTISEKRKTKNQTQEKYRTVRQEISRLKRNSEYLIVIHEILTHLIQSTETSKARWNTREKSETRKREFRAWGVPSETTAMKKEATSRNRNVSLERKQKPKPSLWLPEIKWIRHSRRSVKLWKKRKKIVDLTNDWFYEF